MIFVKYLSLKKTKLPRDSAPTKDAVNLKLFKNEPIILHKIYK